MLRQVTYYLVALRIFKLRSTRILVCRCRDVYSFLKVLALHPRAYMAPGHTSRLRLSIVASTAHDPLRLRPLVPNFLTDILHFDYNTVGLSIYKHFSLSILNIIIMLPCCIVVMHFGKYWLILYTINECRSYFDLSLQKEIIVNRTAKFETKFVAVATYVTLACA